ncbi:MAG: tetratricopeptide repeat protein [Cyanobacteria bacterium J06635_15]
MMKIDPSPNTPEPAKDPSRPYPISVSIAGHQPLATHPEDEGEANSSSGLHGRPLQVSLLRQVALLEARRGDFKRAIAMLNRLITSHPSDADHYNNRGVIYWRSGQLAAAIADFSTALRLNPGLHNAYNNRANLYAAQGDFSAAIADYQQALNLNPFTVRARINLGITFREVKDYPAAIAYFDEALTFGKLAGQIYAERGRTYHLWGDWNCAVADYCKALPLLQIAKARQVDAPKALYQRVQDWLKQLASGKTA